MQRGLGQREGERLRHLRRRLPVRARVGHRQRLRDAVGRKEQVPVGVLPHRGIEVERERRVSGDQFPVRRWRVLREGTWHCRGTRFPRRCDARRPGDGGDGRGARLEQGTPGSWRGTCAIKGTSSPASGESFFVWPAWVRAAYRAVAARASREGDTWQMAGERLTKLPYLRVRPTVLRGAAVGRVSSSSGRFLCPAVPDRRVGRPRPGGWRRGDRPRASDDGRAQDPPRRARRPAQNLGAHPSPKH